MKMEIPKANLLGATWYNSNNDRDSDWTTGAAKFNTLVLANQDWARRIAACSGCASGPLHIWRPTHLTLWRCSWINVCDETQSSHHGPYPAVQNYKREHDTYTGDRCYRKERYAHYLNPPMGVSSSRLTSVHSSVQTSLIAAAQTYCIPPLHHSTRN